MELNSHTRASALEVLLRRCTVTKSVSMTQRGPCGGRGEGGEASEHRAGGGQGGGRFGSKQSGSWVMTPPVEGHLDRK